MTDSVIRTCRDRIAAACYRGDYTHVELILQNLYDDGILKGRSDERRDREDEVRCHERITHTAKAVFHTKDGLECYGAVPHKGEVLHILERPVREELTGLVADDAPYKPIPLRTYRYDGRNRRGQLRYVET